MITDCVGHLYFYLYFGTTVRSLRQKGVFKVFIFYSKPLQHCRTLIVIFTQISLQITILSSCLTLAPAVYRETINLDQLHASHAAVKNKKKKTSYITSQRYITNWDSNGVYPNHEVEMVTTRVVLVASIKCSDTSQDRSVSCFNGPAQLSHCLMTETVMSQAMFILAHVSAPKRLRAEVGLP